MTTTPTEPQYDRSAVASVEQPGNDAWAQAGKLAASTDYTRDYRIEGIGKLLPPALAEAEREAAAELAKLDKAEPALQQQARRPILPSTLDAARVQAVKDALHAEAPSTPTQDMWEKWEQALNGDPESAWVFYYHGETLLRRTLPKELQKFGIDKERYEQLRERTDDTLATPEQRAARVKLREVQETRKRINGALVQTRARLNGWRLDGDTLIDGLQASMRAKIKF
jgi:hypothetical protein